MLQDLARLLQDNRHKNLVVLNVKPMRNFDLKFCVMIKQTFLLIEYVNGEKSFFTYSSHI